MAFQEGMNENTKIIRFWFELNERKVSNFILYTTKTTNRKKKLNHQSINEFMTFMGHFHLNESTIKKKEDSIFGPFFGWIV